MIDMLPAYLAVTLLAGLALGRRFPATTTLPIGPYPWHRLAVTGALSPLSAAALARRLRVHHGRSGKRVGRRPDWQPGGLPPGATHDRPG